MTASAASSSAAGSSACGSASATSASVAGIDPGGAAARRRASLLVGTARARVVSSSWRERLGVRVQRGGQSGCQSPGRRDEPRRPGTTAACTARIGRAGQSAARRARARSPACRQVRRSAWARAVAALAARRSGSAASRSAVDERVDVGLEHEAVGRELEARAASVPSAQRRLVRRDPPGAGLGGEVVGRAAGGDDQRLPAGERLERRQAEALAAVGLDEHVGGAVERGEPVVRHLVVEQEQLGRAGVAAKASIMRLGGLARGSRSRRRSP